MELDWTGGSEGTLLPNQSWSLPLVHDETATRPLRSWSTENFSAAWSDADVEASQVAGLKLWPSRETKKLED